MTRCEAIVVAIEMVTIGFSCAVLGVHFESWTVGGAMFALSVALYDRRYLA